MTILGANHATHNYLHKYYYYDYIYIEDENKLTKEQRTYTPNRNKIAGKNSATLNREKESAVTLKTIFIG